MNDFFFGLVDYLLKVTKQETLGKIFNSTITSVTRGSKDPLTAQSVVTKVFLQTVRDRMQIA